MAASLTREQRDTGRLRRWASAPRLILGTAIATLILGTLAGVLWIITHRAFWEGEFHCSADMGVSDPERLIYSAVAVAAALVLIVIVFRIAQDTSRIRPATVIGYWATTAVLWLFVVVTFMASRISVNACLRDLQL